MSRMSSALSDLPFDILPLIIQYIVRPNHLSQLCLVNKVFHLYATIELYNHPTIFAWHKGSKENARRLLTTLADSPNLARHVKKLELRDFPKGLAGQDLSEICVRAIENCVNLVACTWTRDGSLTSEILEALSICTQLSSLEINGHSSRDYDPALLTRFPRLSHLSIIMPSSELIAVLPACLHRNQNTLVSFNLTCKFTTLITDELLKSISSSLSSLKNFRVAGCTKLTHIGLKSILSTNSVGIKDLALEGISTSFDWKEFGEFCSRTQALEHLESITLGLPAKAFQDRHIENIEKFLRDSPLRQFHLYVSTRPYVPVLSHDFIQRFMDSHADRLQRFAIFRLPINHLTLDLLVRRGIKLEQLFITHGSITIKYLENTMRILKQTKTINSLHINYASEDFSEQEELSPMEPLLQQMFEDPNSGLPSMEEIQCLAKLLPKTVHQFGLLTKVWKVERDISNGSVRLGPYDRPDIPDAFLVART